MPGEYFVDVHCHLFNIEDIPLYATLANTEGLPNVALALAAGFGAHKRFLDERTAFLNFFDRRRKENAEWLASQVASGLVGTSQAGRPVVLTPLVMDFDLIGEAGHKSLESVYYQTERLRKEIGCATLPATTRILPFAGLDLRKLNAASDVPAFVEEWLAASGGMLPATERRAPSAIENGKLLGVKLYPPIGFNPFSDESAEAPDPKRIEFYKYCSEQNIPITVHCQSGSYSGYDVDQHAVNAFTHPRNWAKVFEHLSPKHRNRLHINFAHFGGEEEIKRGVLPDIQHEEVHNRGPRRQFAADGWLWTLLRLLKLYPHTYTDLAAFNYANQGAVLALGWLLVLDESGQLDARIGLSPQPLKLKDKLLWGSDVPMILGKEKGGLLLKKPTGCVEEYGRYFAAFLQAMDIRASKCSPYGMPDPDVDKIPSVAELVDLLTSTNPARFLFGWDA